MRQIGTLSNQADAARFAAYLVVQGINAQAEPDGSAWALWVRDEDQLPAARTALAEFQSDPKSAKFHGVEQTAEQRKREEAAKREAARQNVVTMGNRWGRTGAAGRRPLTILTVLICGIIGLFTNMGEDHNSEVFKALQFCNPKHQLEGWKPESVSDKLIDIRAGQVWRIVTPALLHGNAMHLAFNVVMFWQLATIIEFRRGTGTLAWLMLATAIPSNLAQALMPEKMGGTVYFVGLSGVVFGLLGYLWMKSRFDPASGMFISTGTIFMAFVFLALGFAGFFNTGGMGIANWCHGVGFVTGILIGWVPIAIKNGFRNT